MFIAILVLVFAGAAQQLPAQSFNATVDSIRLELTPTGNAGVSFLLVAGDANSGSRHAVLYTPVIYKDGSRAELPAILVKGKRAGIADKRDNLTQRRGIDGHNTKTVRPGTAFHYNASAPYEPWMAGAELRFETSVVACGASADLPDKIIASNLFTGDTARIVRILEPESPPKTVADIQAERFSFVAPISEFEKAREDIAEGVTFDDNMLLHLGKAVGKEKQAHVEKFVERNKPGSLIIYYRQNKTDIDPGYKNNSVWLERLVESVTAIEASENSRVERVVIAGFASPEGTPEHNDMLAWERARTVKSIILEETSLKEEKIRVFNGSEDWLGLRSMVETSILSNREKEEVFRIIDTFPREEGSAKDGRLGELMRLNGGRTYKYMYDNLFPELRNAAYIKVYYENNY